MQRYFAQKKEESIFVLKDSDYYHIKTVMRMLPNDKIEVVYQNELYISYLDSNYQVVLLEKIKTQNNKTIEKVLCIPLLSEQKFSFVLQKATELGIDRIIPLKVERSIVRLDESKESKKYERWYRICKEASEQSKRLEIPIIDEIKKIDDLYFDGLKLICSTVEKENTIKKVLQKNKISKQVVLLVGPEGGFSAKEEKKAILNGFIPISLGENILRVETVPIVLLIILNY